MLYRMGESGYTEITGFRNAKFQDAEAFLKAHRKETPKGVELQFFDADLIATDEHLYFAVLNAMQAFQNETNISKSLAVETMLYASAQRQIRKAIQLCGITPQTTNMAVVIIGKDPAEIKTAFESVKACVGTEPDDAVLNMTREKLEKIKEAFQIRVPEINAVIKEGDVDAAVVSLVVERVALLATQL